MKMNKDEHLMERALNCLKSLRDTHPDMPTRNANGLRYIIEDLEKRIREINGG